MAPWANQWFNASLRIGAKMCDILKYTSLGKPPNLWGLVTDFAFEGGEIG